ncbi:hypothetical protein KGF41_14245 [Clostridioides sp. ZZV14-6150]|uniref:hypothetical protein n=1 Tax=Clostridioides sp. ZZV14-6150 TaxID=2811493 RepID=UPI001D0FB9CC|nr:hypothetical protein [Clostridioides sp. ZZV14-6150]
MRSDIKESSLTIKDKTKTFELEESKLKLLLNLLETELEKDDNKNLEELKELNLIFKEPYANEEIVNKFILKYKDKEPSYSGSPQSVKLGDKIYAVYCNENDTIKYIGVYDYIPFYESLIEDIEKYANSGVFKEKEFYIDKLNDFKKDINNLGIEVEADDECEYQIATMFHLPVEKVLDDNFISAFIKIIEEYEKNVEEELIYIYKR